MPASKRPPSRIRAISAPLVLVVDDFEDARMMYVEYLEYDGFRTAAAATGEDALELAVRLRPDIILMDLSLPGIDGWQATRVLKSDARTAKIPVLALTAHAEPALRKRSEADGFASFLVKPLLPAVLSAHVRSCLGRASRRAIPARRG
jgi:two-component system, cell cycle response regulator DivK